MTTTGLLQFDDKFRILSPQLFPIRRYKYIAPYWANADTSRCGQLFYRQTNDPDLLDRAASEIRAAFPVHEDFEITNLFIVTWDEVGYIGSQNDKVCSN